MKNKKRLPFCHTQSSHCFSAPKRTHSFQSGRKTRDEAKWLGEENCYGAHKDGRLVTRTTASFLKQKEDYRNDGTRIGKQRRSGWKVLLKEYHHSLPSALPLPPQDPRSPLHLVVKNEQLNKKSFSPLFNKRSNGSPNFTPNPLGNLPLSTSFS